MKGLVQDLEIAISDAISSSKIDVDVNEFDSDKLAKLMQSKTDAFIGTKQLIFSWQNSQNAPSQDKLRRYVQRLVETGHKSVETLREALRKKIGEIDPDKIGLAVKSKSIIFTGINSINASIIELQNQLEADKIDLKQREFSRGYPEKYANQEFYPEKNYHQKWYDEETESIMICPLGTKGEIIILDNLKIMLPKVPKAKSKILFSNLPIEEQYWRREEMPKGLTPENEEIYTEYILEQFRKRREGVWFMNKGVPVYITGTHWMGLQWNKMLDTGGYKEFRMAQRNMYIFGRACVLDKQCVGELFVKGRRTGFTEEKIDDFIDVSTSTKQALLGITSKTEDDARMAFLKYSYTIQNLPFFFIPVVKGKIDDRNKMEFGKVSENTKIAKLKRQTSTEDYLNTTVDFQATTILAYDSTKLIRYLCDEAGKRLKPNDIESHYANVKPTMVTGGRVVGKCYMGSTLNPLDKGGQEFKNLYYGSDVTKRNENGRTTTGLYSYFLPAHQNMEDYTDKYGICHTVVADGDYFINAQGEKKTRGSLQFLEAEFKSAKAMGDKAYNNARRLDPITIEDAFRDELVGQLLNTEKINTQLNFNKDTRAEERIARGNFHWINGIRFGEVEWIPNPKGKFITSWLPTKEMRNKFVMKNIFGYYTKCPINGDIGAFGCDPYDQSAVIDSQLKSTENGIEHSLGSKGALHGYTGFNLANVPSNQFFLEYITRPKEADIFFEDVLMACVFYSMPILVENNKKMLLKFFKTNGFRGYSITRFDKEMNRLSQDEKELGGMPGTGSDAIQLHWTSLESYVEKYIGEYNPEEGETPIREVGQIGSMPFERTLRDWLKFNTHKRTDFDASISSGLAILAVNRNMYKPIKQELKTLNITFKKYNN
jgi:hypothetical protein